MKHLKLLGLAAMAVMALIVFPASAGAAGSVLCTVQESPCFEASQWHAGTELDFSLRSGTKSILQETGAEGLVLDECTGSTAKGEIEKPEPATGPVKSLTWSGCTSTTITLKPGKLQVEHIVGTHNGTVKGDSETEVTINTVLFGTCVYGPLAGTNLGELKEGKPATFVANAVLDRLTGSKLICPETTKWTAEYVLTEPNEKTLSVELGPEPVFCTVQKSPCPESSRWVAGTTLDFSLKTGTTVSLVERGGEGKVIEACSGSTAKGKLEKAEGVTGPIESLTWSGCTFPATTLEVGKLKIENIAESHNGTVKADGTTEVTVNTSFFGSCIYGVTNGLVPSLGELKEGKPAIFVANAELWKFSGSNAVCPESVTMTGEYTLTEPKEATLSVEAGTVNDSVFCTAQESPCPEVKLWSAGTELDFSLKSGTTSSLVNTKGESLDTCTSSTAKGKIEKAEGVTGTIESLTWGGCSFPTTTTLLGKLEVSRISGTHNGTVKGDSETKVTINTVLFGTCVYGPLAGTNLGELKEGKPATFVANAVLKKFSGSGFACPETSKWTAEYTLTEPAERTLSVESG